MTESALISVRLSVRSRAAETSAKTLYSGSVVVAGHDRCSLNGRALEKHFQHRRIPRVGRVREMPDTPSRFGVRRDIASRSGGTVAGSRRPK